MASTAPTPDSSLPQRPVTVLAQDEIAPSHSVPVMVAQPVSTSAGTEASGTALAQGQAASSTVVTQSLTEAAKPAQAALTASPSVNMGITVPVHNSTATQPSPFASLMAATVGFHDPTAMAAGAHDTADMAIGDSSFASLDFSISPVKFEESADKRMSRPPPRARDFSPGPYGRNNREPSPTPSDPDARAASRSTSTKRSSDEQASDQGDYGASRPPSGTRS